MKINMNTSRPSAFISSTFLDLREDRQTVAKILKERGLNVNALDVRPASTQSSKKEIVSGIRESDFIILIIGDRYGSILKSMTGSDIKSLTWWEYNRAIMMRKPVIAYFKYFNSNDSKTHDDINDPLYKRKRRLFERFKKIIIDKHNPAYYTHPNELAKKVDKALISIYRSGVKELTLEKARLNDKISGLESELAKLKSQLSIKNNNSKLSMPKNYSSLLQQLTKRQT